VSNSFACSSDIDVYVCDQSLAQGCVLIVDSVIRKEKKKKKKKENSMLPCIVFYFAIISCDWC